MNNLWDKEFRPLDVQTPKDIIDEQCRYLETLTNGNVTAKIREYREKIDFTNEPYPNIKVQDMLSNASLKKLGEAEENCFTYEFFLTSRNALSYKYRVMFIKYGIEFYPTSILLDGSIANEIKLDTFFTCSNADEFEKALGKILNSNKIEKIINGLLALDNKEALPFNL